MKCQENLTLKNATLNEEFIVVKIDDKLGLNMVRRLGDLGVYEGTNIKILKKSFLGKTFLVSLNGYTLSFRDSIAKIIEVKRAV